MEEGEVVVLLRETHAAVADCRWMAATFGNCHCFTQRSDRLLEPSQAFVAYAQGVQNPAQLHQQRERFQSRRGLGESLHALDEVASRECTVPEREPGQGDGLGGCT